MFLKNTEWSKRLLVFIETMLILTFILVCISVHQGLLDGLVAWIAGIFSLATIAFGFYYWKAKCENLKKYTKNLTKEEIEKIAIAYDRLFYGVNKDEDI